MFANAVLHGFESDGVPPGCEPEHFLSFWSSWQPVASLIEILSHEMGRGSGDGYHSSFAVLGLADEQPAVGEIEILEFESKRLAGAKASSVRDFEECSVSQACGYAEIANREPLFDNFQR